MIVLAGPLSNIACAFVLYWLIFLIGFTTIKPLIGNITPDSIAAISGLKANQEITQISTVKPAFYLDKAYGCKLECKIILISLKRYDVTNCYK